MTRFVDLFKKRRVLPMVEPEVEACRFIDKPICPHLSTRYDCAYRHGKGLKAPSYCPLPHVNGKLVSLLLVLLCLAPVPASALEIFWNRNVEPDMDRYHVYLCRTKGCSVDAIGQLWIAEIPQPPESATEVVYGPLPNNIEGAVCVTAMDRSGLNSACSAPLVFSTLPDLPPAAPTGLRSR